MKMIVTGGAGFIGSHLVDRIAKKATIIDDLSGGSRINPESVFVKKSILDELDFGESEILFHLAAQVSVPKSIENPSETMRINVDGTRNVLECAIKSDIKRVVFASSAAVYGDSPSAAKESQQPAPQDPYGQSKLEGERLMKKYYEENDLSTISLRFFNVYGPRMNGGVIRAFIENEQVKIFGNGSQVRDFVYVDDVVDAMLIASGSKITGEFNVGTGSGTTLMDLLGKVEHVYGKREVQYLEERKGDIRYSVADTKKSSKVLGFNSLTSLKSGLLKIKEQHDNPE